MLHVHEDLMLIHVQILRSGPWLPSAGIKAVADEFFFIMNLNLLSAIPGLALKKFRKNIENKYWNVSILWWILYIYFKNISKGFPMPFESVSTLSVEPCADFEESQVRCWEKSIFFNSCFAFLCFLAKFRIVERFKKAS